MDFDPNDKYFAVGSADAVVSLWDLQSFICLRTFTRLDWPVRTLSFSHDGKYIASASEDLVLDISEVGHLEHRCLRYANPLRHFHLDPMLGAGRNRRIGS